MCYCNSFADEPPLPPSIYSLTHQSCRHSMSTSVKLLYNRRRGCISMRLLIKPCVSRSETTHNAYLNNIAVFVYLLRSPGLPAVIATSTKIEFVDVTPFKLIRDWRTCHNIGCFGVSDQQSPRLIQGETNEAHRLA